MRARTKTLIMRRQRNFFYFAVLSRFLFHIILSHYATTAGVGSRSQCNREAYTSSGGDAVVGRYASNHTLYTVHCADLTHAVLLQMRFRCQNVT